MPTYGKKRKGILSSFSVFQDDKPEQDSKQQRSTYVRLGNVRTALSRTRSRVKMEDESANNGDTGLQKETRSLHDYTAPVLQPQPTSSRSTKNMTEELDKPLPPIPHKASLQEQHSHARPALGTKSANMKVSGASRLAKAGLSLSALQETTTATDENLSRTATTGTITQTPKTSMAEADDLQRKITYLMMQATIQEEETKKTAHLYDSLPAKLSPFQRSKKAFVKATRAIKDRLSSHSNGPSPKANLHSPSDASQTTSGDISPLSDDNYSRNRLNRRIAEGQNLANPKIRAMVGDGNIPRKPLPVYESMRSRIQRSVSSDDPFSDGNEAIGTPSPQVEAGFDFDFAKRTDERKTAKDPVPDRLETDGDLAGAEQHLSVPQSLSRFSNMISGLAQHPDVADLSSSPLGSSTPRVRLEPQKAPDSRSAKGTKPNKGTLIRSTSILEFSFEGRSEDEQSLAPSTNSDTNSNLLTDGSQSVKRKSAHSDLRSPCLPASKRSKLVSASSNDEAKLAIGIRRMDTDDDQAPLASKDRNSKLDPSGQPANKGRGLRTFDLGNGRTPECKVDEKGKKPRPRPIIAKRSSFPRPGSMLFGGRDSRAGLRRLTARDSDSMDIDELQMDDAAYQVGGKKR